MKKRNTTALRNTFGITHIIALEKPLKLQINLYFNRHRSLVVEQMIRNHQVGSSNLFGGFIYKKEINILNERFYSLFNL